VVVFFGQWRWVMWYGVAIMGWNRVTDFKRTVPSATDGKSVVRHALGNGVCGVVAESNVQERGAGGASHLVLR
jgi:hypothetical protein